MGKQNGKQNNGFVQIPIEIIDTVLKLPPAECKLMAAIFRIAFGWHLFEFQTSITTLANLVGLNRVYTKRLLDNLTRRGLIAITNIERGKPLMVNGKYRFIPALGNSPTTIIVKLLLGSTDGQK